MNRREDFWGIPVKELVEELALRTGLTRSRAEEIARVLMEMMDEDPSLLREEDLGGSAISPDVPPAWKPGGGGRKLPPS